MVSLTSSEFFKIQSGFSHIPYSQSSGWYKYQKARGENLVFYVDDAENVSIGFMGRIKSIPIIGDILIVEGEVIKYEVPIELIREFYHEISNLPYAGIEIDSNNSYDIKFEIGIRRAGFIRPLSFLSCPLTSIIDLTKPLKLNKNWKYNYRKALKNDLMFEEIINPNLHIAKEFLQIYKELLSRKGLKYSLNYNAILELVNDDNMRLFIVKLPDGAILSGGIVYTYGVSGYYIFAANSKKAHETGASRLIMKCVFEKLAEEGIEKCDFGRIPPSNNISDNIYTFKNGIDGEKIQYNGEWIYYKSRLKEYIIHFIKVVYRKRQRY